jgi:hypothetical protein
LPKNGYLQRVIDELRTLRRVDGPLTEAKLVDAPAILRGLGSGDGRVALEKLGLSVARHRDVRDIMAALSTIGVDGPEGNLLERLTLLGESAGVDARTVRRWSDSGIVKLAQLIVSESPWLTPVLSAVIDERQVGLVTLSVRFLIPPDIGVQIPTVSVNGVLQEGLEHNRVGDPQDRGKIYQLTEITTELLPDKVAYGANVRWKTEVVPQYRSTTRTPYTTELWSRSFEPAFGGLTIQLFRTLTGPHQVVKSPAQPESSRNW